MAWNVGRLLNRSRCFSLHLQIIRAAYSGQQVRNIQSDPTVASSQHPTGIVIPKRKKRDELSILRALESTVQMDTRSPRYMHIDDPYLIPNGVAARRVCATSKAAGRQAAHYAIKTYPEFFKVSPFNPWLDIDSLLKAFTLKTATDNAEDTIEGLQERIDMRSPELAYASYQAIRDSGQKVPEEKVLDLFDLLCAYNSESQEEVTPEDRYFLNEGSSRLEQAKKRVLQKTWKDDGLAEQLFKEMESPPPRAYCSLLKGRAKYHQTDKAFSLYSEMVENEIPLDLGAYNAILQIAPYLSQEGIWKAVLGHMAANDVTPNLITFNCVIKALQKIKNMNPTFAMKEFFQIFSEMKVLNIDPSLSTWYNFLQAFSAPRFRLLRHKVLDSLQGKEFSMHEPEDMEFFSRLMMVCRTYEDISFAHKLNKLLHTGKNHKMLGDSLNVHNFYSYYFRIMLKFEQIDFVSEYYDKMIPNTFNLNAGAMKELLDAVDLNKSYDFLLKIWESNHYIIASRSANLEHYLAVMSHAPKECLSDKFVPIVDFVLDNYISPTKMTPIYLDGACVGYMMEVYVKAGNYQKAWKSFDIYFNQRTTMMGFPKEKQLVMLGKIAMAEDDFGRLLQILDVMNTVGFVTFEDLIKYALKNMNLTEDQVKQLEYF